MIKKTSYYLTAYFPIVFSISVCSGFGTFAGLVLSCASILLIPEIQPKKLMPFIVSFIVIASSGNPVLTSIVFGFLLLIYTLFFDKIKNVFYGAFNPGIMLAGALTATVLFTTYYFGIGATGNNVTEMIRSYVSLGFHPNWRGVLYGTIVLVLMVTFPRKFKELSKYFSASFIAIIFTLILNLFLNPADMITSITEVPYFSIDYFKDFISSGFDFDFSVSSVLNGIALFLIAAYSFTENNEINRKDLLVNSATNVLSCGILSLPLPYGINKSKSTLIPRLVSVLIIFALFVGFKDIAIRIPLHSCAVVIIVTAWQNVRWSEIKNCFLKIPSIVIFIISFAVSMVTDLSFGIIVSFIISVIYNLLIRKKRPAE